MFSPCHHFPVIYCPAVSEVHSRPRKICLLFLEDSLQCLFVIKLTTESCEQKWAMAALCCHSGKSSQAQPQVCDTRPAAVSCISKPSDLWAVQSPCYGLGQVLIASHQGVEWGFMWGRLFPGVFKLQQSPKRVLLLRLHGNKAYYVVTSLIPM